MRSKAQREATKRHTATVRELQVSMIEKGDTATYDNCFFRMFHQQQLHGKAKTTVERKSHDI